MLKALIFDVDGTLADTEKAHLDAFNAAFADTGSDWRWSLEVYCDLLSVTGGKERILHYWQAKDPHAAATTDAKDMIARLHASKTAHYTSTVRAGKVPLRPGVKTLIGSAQSVGLRLAIATTTTPANIEALLTTNLGSGWRTLFSVIEDGTTALRKKPDPQAYLQALERLGLCAKECIALEDSENGLRAATGAGIATVITPTAFTQGQDFSAALQVLPSLDSAQCLLAQWVLDKHNLKDFLKCA